MISRLSAALQLVVRTDSGHVTETNETNDGEINDDNGAEDDQSRSPAIVFLLHILPTWPSAPLPPKLTMLVAAV